MGEDDKSLFNAGIAKLKRIDQLKMRLHISRENDDYDTWFKCLEGWREEMSERMTDDQDKEANQYERNIQNTLKNQYLELKRKLLKGYGIFLSKIEYKIGFSMPDADDPNFALR